MFLRKTNNVIKSLRNIPNEDEDVKVKKEKKPSLRQMFYDIPKSLEKNKNKNNNSKNTKNNTKKK